MGFCQRCGEITVTPRCKCGGTAKETSTQLLFRGSGGDKWSQRYVAKTTSPSAASLFAPAPISSAAVTSSSASKLGPTSTNSPSATPRGGAHLPASATPGTPVRPPIKRNPTTFVNHELSSVFGSVLSPKDQWECAACQHRFVQEEVIYPHPNAKVEAQLSELYFCRECFADRFSKGTCKKCKCAVLSDAPFIRHDDQLWHESCYTCSYCLDPQTDPVIDFAGKPSCEACFDSEAYKTKGVPPSPHLAQKGFEMGPVKANLRPAPSRWGGSKAKLNLSPAVKPTTQRQDHSNTPAGNRNSALLAGNDRAVPGWRLWNEREKSPIAASLDEMGNTFRRLGLERSELPLASSKRTNSAAQLTPVSSPTSSTYGRDVTGPPAVRNTTSRTAPVWSEVPGINKSIQPKEGSSPTESTHCSVCNLVLGYGEFVQLQGKAGVMHKACFLCGGCRKPLEQGRHIEAGGQIWHQDCAPPPKMFRTIETSLAQPQLGQPRKPYVPTSPVQDPCCRSCRLVLGLGYNISTSGGTVNYCAQCFKCAACSQLFGGTPSHRSFIEVAGLPYHTRCAPPPSPKRAEENPSTPLRASTSRAPSSLPLAPSQTKIFHTPPSTNSAEKPRSIFATRERPPENLGGLLVCAGCSVRATERETKSGPLGKRYHPRCLKCGLCSRTVDSESRIGANGELRCESCRKIEARRSTNPRSSFIHVPSVDATPPRY